MYICKRIQVLALKFTVILYFESVPILFSLWEKWNGPKNTGLFKLIEKTEIQRMLQCTTNKHSRLSSRVVSVLYSLICCCCGECSPPLSCNLPCSQLGIETLTPHFAMQIGMCIQSQGHGGPHVWQTCGVWGGPPVVRLPKKPSA